MKKGFLLLTLSLVGVCSTFILGDILAKDSIRRISRDEAYNRFLKKKAADSRYLEKKAVEASINQKLKEQKKRKLFDPAVVLGKKNQEKSVSLGKKKQELNKKINNKISKKPKLNIKLQRKYAKPSGLEQSPINLSKSFAFQTNLTDVQFNYQDKQSMVIKNTGRVITCSFSKRNSKRNYVVVDSQRYYLDHISFNTPSEHRIDWKFYPAEVHFVHMNKVGDYIIIGVFLDYGKTRHNSFGKLICKMPKSGKTSRLKEVRLMKLFPDRRVFYRYNGSLTTSPYTENVKWFVMQEPVILSLDQIWDLENKVPVIKKRSVQLPEGRALFIDAGRD